MDGQKSAFLRLKNFLIKRDLGKKQIQQLIEYSNTDPLIKKFTSDAKRFKNLKAYKNWRKNKKVIYALSDKKDNLLGFTWFSKEESSFRGYPFTFAIRTYAAARGKGLSKEFMRISFENFMNSNLYQKSKEKGVWLEVSADNASAIKIYQDFGFKKPAKPDKNKKIIMLMTPLEAKS